MTIYLIDGKPMRLCDCDERAELCPRGVKRALQTCGFSRCFIPAPDAIYTAAPSAAPDAALPGLELAKKICEDYEEKSWEAYKNGHFPDRANPHTQGASNGASDCAKAIRDEIAKRTP